ncbi:iron(III) transport system ATP-binding protein [Neorhizobium sp. 2083]|uniref:ABC transporter ATP-binding protein n=1 Tax=Neorhizobium sp. 2083 TaxID=2817762 RepID=UPI00285CCC19|nr:ABC transporter ATP-binding protein [Neorhizobium sp. 2083]MDR6817546.1 iron(III) transport system ATP-binding protein [Neorhizobium sp. 2083]
MTDLVLSDVTRRYGSVNAIDHINITVGAGEFLTLLGPSGCGKSTTLAAIAGLDQPTGGRISFGDRTLFDGGSRVSLPPEARGFGVVFQSYALWPHMTVERNVDLSLRLRKVDASERDRRVGEALELVGLTAYAKRYPGELSGGQQQRVALARAVVFRPALLLLDEPLSNLDAQLRGEARIWLKNIQRELGLTAIYVTHDQEEALSMSDRIVVMRGGHVIQMGTPQEIYERPIHPFSASFIGSANLISGGLIAAVSADGATVGLPGGQTLQGHAPLPVRQGEAALVAVRPQNIRLTEDADANRLLVRFGPANYLGDRFEQEAFLGESPLRLQAARPVPEGEGSIWIARQDVLIFPPDEGAKDKT